MQLIKLATLLSMAATTIAAPSVSVERTNGGSTDACGQNQVLSCCTQGQSAETPLEVISNLDSTNLSYIVALLLATINTEIQTGCTWHLFTLLLTILPPGYDANGKTLPGTALVSEITCSGQQACCVSNAGTDNTNTNTESGGVKDLLQNSTTLF
jgi:hypothetical protein